MHKQVGLPHLRSNTNNSSPHTPVTGNNNLLGLNDLMNSLNHTNNGGLMLPTGGFLNSAFDSS
ncbi:hypothetical protein ACPWR0_24090, partial [Pandoraea pneumonica]